MASAADVEKVRRRLKEDTPFWAEHCATILDPAKKPVKLVPRPWQARMSDTPAGMVPLDEALEDQRAAGQPMRAIILKARKLGMSTWVQAKFLQRLTQNPYQYALSVAHLRSSAGQLADMAAIMYDRLPNQQQLGMGFSIKPQLLGKSETRQGGRWYSYGDKMRPSEQSVYETQSAGTKGGGRAMTPSMLHLSEAAHFEDPEYIVGVMNSVPKEPETIVVIESTANGFNEFHDRWVRAVEGAEDPETGGLYTPLFYGWHANPYNSIPFVSDEGRERFVSTIGDPAGGGDEEEPWLIEEFGCTPEQLRWRRVTRDEECDGKVEVFHQEHPATPEQAFIGSGNPVFSSILIARAIRDAEQADEPVRGVLRGEDFRERRTKTGTVLVPQRVAWVPETALTAEDKNLWGATWKVRVWEHPVVPPEKRDVDDSGLSAQAPAHIRAQFEQAAAAATDEFAGSGQYVIFADVAQGEGTTIEDKDYSAITVLDHVTRKQVAAYHARIPIHDLPMILFLVGTYYNSGILTPEVNGLGIGVLDALNQDLAYPLLYRRRRGGDDRRSDTREQVLGWMTDLRSKPLMEQTMAEALKDGTHGIRDVGTARELTTYVEDDRGRHGAQKGSHDDRVMSYMGANRIAHEMQPRPAKKRKRARDGVDPLTGY